MKKSDEKHYSKKVCNFYQRHGISIDGYLPETEYKDDSSCVIVSCAGTGNRKISVVRNFSFEYLYNVCELYRDFADGKDLSIDNLYLIASNLFGSIPLRTGLFAEYSYGYCHLSWSRLSAERDC